MADPEFVSWCERHGIIFNGITAGYVSEGWRGIVATKDLKTDDVILRIPERLLLTTRSARRDPQLAVALSRQPAALTPHQLLAVHLLHEVSKGPDSFWWPYLRQLPRSYSSLLNFSEDEATALQLQTAQDVALVAEEQARADWRAALPLMQELGLSKRYTVFRAWAWAASTLNSRTMYLPWCSAGALTPYGDLHNYQPPASPYTPQLSAEAAASASTVSATCNGAPANSSPAGGLLQRGAPVSAVEPDEVTADSLSGRKRLSEGTPPNESGLATEDANVAGPRDRNQTQHPSSAGPAPRAVSAAVQHERRPQVTDQLPQAPLPSGADASCSSSPGDEATEGATHGPMPANGAAGGGGAATEGLDTAGGVSYRDGSGREGSASDERAATVRLPQEAPQEAPLAASEARDPAGPGEGAFQPAATEAGVKAGAEAAIAGDGLWDEATQEYCIVVRKPYRCGDQVMLCYGRYTNLDLLEHYGFVLEDNPHDTAPLNSSLLPAPPPSSDGRHPWTAPALYPSDCFLHANGQPSWQLLHYLRYLAASPEERRSQGHVMAAGEPVSQEGDRQVLLWLYQACTQQLAALGTSLKQDLQQQQATRIGGRDAGTAPQPPPTGALGSSAGGSHDLCPQGAFEPLGPGGGLKAVAGGVGPGEPQTCSALRASEVQASEAAAGNVEGHTKGAGETSSDGLTCGGLALQWRILHKRILQRAVRLAEGVLGPQLGAGGGPAGAAGAVRDLQKLLQRQRQRLKELGTR